MTAGTINEAVITLDAGTQVALAISLAFTMFTVALGLKTDDFSFLKSHKRSVAFGLAAQIIGLPLITLLLLYVFQPMAGIALGMLIVACCPGGNVSNLFTRLSRGDVAYSVSLTTCSSIFAAAFLPLTILFWTGMYAPTRTLVDTIHLDRVDFVLNTGFTLLLPLLLGIALAHKRPDIAHRLQRFFLPIAVLIIAAIIVVGLSTNIGLLQDFAGQIMPFVILHNMAAFTVGALIGALCLRTRAGRRALVFEIGIQNSGLGLLIMLSQFGGLGSGAMVIATWGIWHFIGGFAVTGIFRLADRLRTSSHPVQEDLHGI